jgi:hypothetical protein
MVWPGISFGGPVTLRIIFPEDAADRATEVTQQRALETTFESLVLPPIRPRIATEPETRLEEIEVDGQKELREVVVRRPLEISSLLEVGRLSLLDADGTQVAVKALLEQNWESGLNLSLNLGFEHFNLDDGDGDGNSYLVNLGAHQEFLHGLVKLGGLLTWRFVDTDVVDVRQEVHSFGFGIFAAAEKDFGPLIVSGGLIYQFLQDTGDLERSNHLLSYGLEVGIPLGQRFIINLEVFQINNVERDEDPVIIGAGGTFYVTKRWGVTLGWKTILNVDGFTSHEGVVGASARF